MFNLYNKYLNYNDNKILVLGEKGYLASRYKEWSDERDAKFDFCSSSQIGEDPNILLEKIKEIDIVINTIAETSVNSTDFGVVKKQLGVNSEWPLELAKLSLKENFKLIHISTADLYSSGGNENGEINFNTGYYYSKHLGDKYVLETNPNSLILRPRLLFDDRNNDKNLISKLKKYNSLIRSSQSVSSTDLVVAASLFLANYSGIYNICEENPVDYSKLDLNKEYIYKSKKVIDVSKLKSSGFELEKKAFKKYFEKLI